jgi:far upstream element-binding protein
MQKGGEQIRDLQARADCKVDVDQSGPPGAPKIITYQGTRTKIDFAKKLVRIICNHRSGMGQIELPLGYATKKQLQVPSTVIGKIIGRSGDMIKELQTKSQCKIQVDHSQGNNPTAPRSVTVVGNPNAVIRAEEMVNIIIANPQADASNTIDLLIREKNQGASKWGSGPPYSTMPNGGQGMMGNVSVSSMNQGYGSSQSQGQQYSQAFGHQSSQSYGSGHSSSTETDIFYSSKMYMGRIIGAKGVTINDLQKQSGCDIQINQNVPQGRDCEITIKGSRKGIERAKQMLNDIISMGPNHPYAGGQSGSNVGYSNQQYGGSSSYGSQMTYETQQYQPQQQHYVQPFGQVQPKLHQLPATAVWTPAVCDSTATTCCSTVIPASNLRRIQPTKSSNSASASHTIWIFVCILWFSTKLSSS